MVRKQKKASFLVCDTKLTQRPQSNHIPVVFMGNTTISFPSDMVLEVHTKDDQQQDETSAERKSEAVTNEYVLVSSQERMFTVKKSTVFLTLSFLSQERGLFIIPWLYNTSVLFCRYGKITIDDG
jgi:hypothetical protein